MITAEPPPSRGRLCAERSVPFPRHALQSECDAGLADEHADARWGTVLRELAHVFRMLWQSGRPVLCLILFCLAAAAALSPIDGTPAFVFLLAGGSALATFALLARDQ